jgi:hypothetical protein
MAGSALCSKLGFNKKLLICFRMSHSHHPSFSAMFLRLWAYRKVAKIDFSHGHANPTDNAFVEFFNGTLWHSTFLPLIVYTHEAVAIASTDSASLRHHLPLNSVLLCTEPRPMMQLVCYEVYVLGLIPVDHLETKILQIDSVTSPW